MKDLEIIERIVIKIEIRYEDTINKKIEVYDYLDDRFGICGYKVLRSGSDYQNTGTGLIIVEAGFKQNEKQY